MRDIVFLFGAGASTGAGDIVPETPPLGKDLYPELVKNYPFSWGSLPSAVQTRFEQDGFEAGMAVVYHHHSHAIAALMRHLALYLIQFRPFSQSSLYNRLLRELNRLGLLSRVVFASLNYDCILEFSLLQERIAFVYGDEPADRQAIPVWKLHGSCNMFSTDVQATQDVLFTSGATFGGSLEAYFDIGTVAEKCLASGLYPAMCLFMEGKPLQISPSVILSLQARWRTAVSQSHALICVGVNPRAPDSHIWEPINKTEACLYFIGGANGFDAWAKKHRVGRYEFLGPRFHSSFSTLIGRLATHEAY